MVKLIKSPAVVQAAGNKPKIIQEFIGKVNSNTSDLSIASMQSPKGWVEPGQTPDFDEYTVVLKGCLHVKTKSGRFEVKANSAIIIEKGEWVQYSTPDEATEYLAVCLPAFSPEIVHRDK